MVDRYITVAMYASTDPKWWHQTVHIPIPYPQCLVILPDDGDRNIPASVKERARVVFPDGELVFKGIYTRKVSDGPMNEGAR